MNPWKLRLARGFERSGANRLMLAGQRAMHGPYLRALNYHEVPARDAAAFERQLDYFSRHFECVGLSELEAYLAGRWRPRRPGLVLTFDDGFRSYATVVAPILERRGWTGWFCVPAGLPDAPVADHASFQRAHSLQYDESEVADGRPMLSWDEVRTLDKNHVVVCHSFTHRRLGDLLPADREREIAGAKALLEAQLGHEVRAFAWVGGEEHSYSAASAAAIRDAGFEFGFMTNNAVIRPSTDPLQLQRTNVEAFYPPELLHFSLSGALDLMYWPKRRRVNRITAGPRA